jgi:hypothetical protein
MNLRPRCNNPGFREDGIDSRVTAMNKALLVLISAVRQHELMEAAEALNNKLQAEIESLASVAESPKTTSTTTRD